ncbi:hypothetical protein [Williamsia sterculiae]|uniref:Uncharacterized protein n=1 Tax=Williamsia sterculiae TaxID=1344003 RepID=A0A1N7H3U9_9NOCA|nr:hypothetical protein [Williamsia sterculiae]SIS19525.1 hypothetical protein SAMN05445060_3491 [Williamsia sterculiae]
MGVGDVIGGAVDLVGDIASGAVKYIGGTLEGKSTPTGKGYTGHVDLVGSKIAPDPTRLVSFRRGGVIPGGRQYPEPRGVDHGRPTRAASALQSADRRREGVGLAPARPTRASNSSRPIRMARVGVVGPSGHEPAVAPRGHRVVVVGPRRAAHEIAPGIACPSCAAGITKPVR